MENSSSNSNLETLIQQVQSEPNNWSVRKKAALKLYEDGRYLEAADILWKAPEMPATDVDVAFSIKVVSRARPNRSIRLVYELIRRNSGKPTKNLAMARALNMIGMPMLASRFYGAAVAEDGQLFDLSFEKQTLWYDDSGSLLDQWKDTDQEAKPPLAVPLQDFTGEIIEFEKLDAHSGETGATQAQPAQPAPTAPLSMPKPLPKATEKPVNPATKPTPQQPAIGSSAQSSPPAPVLKRPSTPASSLNKPPSPSPSASGKPSPFVAPPTNDSAKEQEESGAPSAGGPPKISPPVPQKPGGAPILRTGLPTSQVKRPTLLRGDAPKTESDS